MFFAQVDELQPFDLNHRGPINPPDTRQLHQDTKKLFFNKNNMNLPTYMGKNTMMQGGRACYAPYPNMSPLCYKTSPERKDMATDRSPGLKSGLWPGMEHVGDYCAELLNRDKHYWTEEETGLMLELYEENKDYFNDNKTKKTKLWSVIANVINKRFNTSVNSEQCSQKYRNLKAEFLKISDPTSQDGGAKKYGRHFEQMKRLIDAEEKSVINKNSPTSNSANNWSSMKNGGGGNSSKTMVKPPQLNTNNNHMHNIINTTMNNNNMNNNISNTSPSSSTNLSPTDLHNTHLDIQLTQCPSPMRLEEPHLVNDMHVTSLTLTSPITATVSPTLLTTPDDMMTSKLSLPSDDGTSRRLDLETSSNEDGDCKFDPSPDGSEGQCMMNTAAASNAIEEMNRGGKNLCLLENMVQINQAVQQAFTSNANNMINNNNNNNNDSRDTTSPFTGTPSDNTPTLGSGDTMTTKSRTSTTAQEAVEMLKLPLTALTSFPPLPSQQGMLQQINDVTSSVRQNGGSGGGSSRDSGPPSSYGNELKDIFNDYFKSRNKELEVYQNKEKQNIVCMNKCIDVFRKIMMEKIN